MKRFILDIPGLAMFDVTAIKVAQAHQNLKPFICAATGREYMAQLRIETFHDTYRVPCATIEEARMWLDHIRDLSAMASKPDEQPGTEALHAILRTAHGNERRSG
jgi:hypothetical protein